MKLSLAVSSLLLFGISTLFLVLLTLFESSLQGLSVTTERLISVFLLIVPSVVGVVVGALSLQRKEMKRVMAIAGITLNVLFALFFTFVLSFAG